MNWNQIRKILFFPCPLILALLLTMSGAYAQNTGSGVGGPGQGTGGPLSGNSGGGGTVNSCATTGALAEYTGSGTTVGCGNADVTYTTHTLAVGASGLFDLSAMTSTNFKFPSSLASTLFVGLNSSEEPVAATAANAATLIQGLTGCNTTAYVFTPQASDCVPGGVVPNAQTGTTATILFSDLFGRYHV